LGGVFSSEGERFFGNVDCQYSRGRNVLRDGNGNDSGTRSHVHDRVETLLPKLAQGLANQTFGFKSRHEGAFVGAEREEEKLDPPGTVGVRTEVFPVTHFQNS
jgi:hypothetical protein